MLVFTRSMLLWWSVGRNSTEGLVAGVEMFCQAEGRNSRPSVVAVSVSKGEELV